MAAFVTLHGLHGSLHRSQFLGQYLKYPSTVHHNSKPTIELKPHAKFNILEIMGGRGLCNGELGLEQELKRQVDDHQLAASGKEQESSGGTTTQSSITSGNSVTVLEDFFEKEMMGLTGGFPGAEKGLKKFIEENPPSKPGSDHLTLKEAKAIS